MLQAPHASPHPELGLSTGRLAAALEIDSGPSPFLAIDWAQVDRVSMHIAAHSEVGEFEPASWDDDEFWNVGESPSDRSQFFAIGNSINFRFWNLDGGRMRPASGTLDGKRYRGAMYMWRALRLALDRTEGAVLEAEFLREISDHEFDSIFTDDTGRNPLDVARDERIANLRDLGDRLISSWEGRFFNLVQSADRSLVRFARLSAELRAFDDPIFKLTMVNAILHSGSRVYDFADEPLPAIDYHLLKQTLRQGLLRPIPALAERLKTNRLLQLEEARELRRLALVALVGVAERTGLSGEILDNKYWLNRVKCTDRDPVCLDPATAHECPFRGACIQATDFGLPLELTRYY